MNTQLKWLGVATAVSMGLTACGGGGGAEAGDTSTPSATVDTSTIDSFLAYQRSLPAVATIHPETLKKQLAPTDDTAEPTPLTP